MIYFPPVPHRTMIANRAWGAWKNRENYRWLNEKENRGPWSVGAKALAPINHHHEYFDDGLFVSRAVQLAFRLLEQRTKRNALRTDELLEWRDGRRRRHRYRGRAGKGLLDEIWI